MKEMDTFVDAWHLMVSCYLRGVLTSNHDLPSCVALSSETSVRSSA